MNRFWNALIRPIIEEIHANYIVEIGSHTGINTKNILEYCKEHNAHMTSIDPFPQFDIDEFKEEYGDKFEIYTDLSLNVLPKLEDYDVILIDGDHNWYTVYNELKMVEKGFQDKKFPIIFLHDVGWPYARRDLYYNPENIPEEYRQPYKKLGMMPGQTSLAEDGGINHSNYNNAIYENNPQNGILTAIEDFLEESKLDLHFKYVPIFHGLGIIHRTNEDLENYIEKRITNPDFMNQIEEDRINLMLTRNKLNEERTAYKNENNRIKKNLNDNQKQNKLLKGQLEQKVSKLNESKVQLKMKDDELHRNELELKDTKKELASSREIINLMKHNELMVEKLNHEIEVLLNNFYEMEYLNNHGRSIKQRIISTFPSIYILMNRRNGGLKLALKNVKGYNLIKKNHLLDIGFYLNRNKDVKFSGKDPILHYLYNGSKEGRNPSSHFNGKYYLQRYSDVKASKLNPLIHYALYGHNEGRKTVEPQININRLDLKQFATDQIESINGALERKVSIVVPIYNANDDTKKCIESVIKHTNIPYELILIDDCSSDERISDLLDEVEQVPTIRIIRNTENKGFVKNVNIGMQNSKGDLVLLNSDTMVTPKWLQKLVLAAYSDKRIGTVTPLSNAAGAFSVPEIGKNNEIPAFFTLDEMASLVEKVSDQVYMEVPTGNGFCMFIKRETIDDVGLFDEENFGKGYGEENDFSMRAIEKSWKNVLDDSTYIYHKRSASFSSSKQELMEKNRAILDEKYPHYTRMVREFVSDNKYAHIRDKVRDALTRSDPVGLKEKRILYVLHSAGGGTPATNEDLMRNIQKEMDCYVLTSSAKEMLLYRYKDSKLEPIYHWFIESKWSAKDFYNPEFRDIYFNVLSGLKIDIVHIRHLIKHSFDLPRVSKNLGIPTIISFHDFYFVCPSHNLLDENYVYCAGECTEGNGQCFVGDDLKDLPILKEFVPQWRKAVSELFSNISAFVTTTEAVKDIYTSIYPELLERDFKIIEHGRDFDEVTAENNYEVPSKDSPVKIIFPGNLNIVKGSELIKNIKKQDVNNRLEFHFMGMVALHSSDMEDYGIHHGTYKRDEFCMEVAKIKPSFIGILTICSETYCHTLSEAWNCGVPVLSTKIGALEERVNQNGGGWFLEHEDPQKAYQEILRIADSTEEYLEVAEQVKNISLKSTAVMAEEYMDMYSELLLDNTRIPNVDHLKKSLKGKDGFLFLINDSNNEIRQHFDKSYNSKFNSDNFNEKLDIKRDYCKYKKIDYYFFMIPDKSVVCQEHLPFDVCVIKRNSDNINDLPDFTENLDQNCYFKIDSHMNYIGGRELSYSYLNYIDQNFKREDFDRLLNEQITEEKVNIRHINVIGDLLSQKNWSYSPEEKEKYIDEITIKLTKKYLVNKKETLPEEFKIVGVRETEYYYNPDAFTDLRVLILRDSSLTYLKDSLSVYFKEMLLYWDHWIFNKELVDWYKPDLILEIRTERFLENMEIKFKDNTKSKKNE
jgi:GT2 family glycosyltransferase/glycosyltransferase involved in cell wall biosynthesis